MHGRSCKKFTYKIGEAKIPHTKIIIASSILHQFTNYFLDCDHMQRYLCCTPRDIIKRVMCEWENYNVSKSRGAVSSFNLYSAHDRVTFTRDGLRPIAMSGYLPLVIYKAEIHASNKDNV